MSTKKPRVLSTLILFTAFGGFACSSGVDLVERGNVRAEVSESQRYALGRPSVREKDGAILVSGSVRQLSWGASVATDHVHVEVVDSAGSPVQRASARWSPDLKPRRPRSPAPGTAYYHARLAGPLANGSTVRVSLARDSHPDGLKE